MCAVLNANENKTNNKPNVLLISIDALKMEFLLEQDRLGVKLPFLTSYFMDKGAIAVDGMKSVFPPFTYPCHQSMITGTNPKTHGITNNIMFDPMKKHKGAWHWFASRKVTTLWEAAKQAGYVSGSAAFPTSVGAKGDYIAPEFWWDGSALDSEFIDVMSQPQGLISEMEEVIGRYAGGLDLSDAGDVQRFKAARWLLSEKMSKSDRPFFMSAYFASFDESAHQFGVYSKEAAQSLEKIDAMVQQLVETAEEISGSNLIVCVVSDHGTLDNTHCIYPNVVLEKAGLITVDESGAVTAWKAFSQRAGGISEIRLAPEATEEDRHVLEATLKELAADENSGILEVITGEQARERGGFPKGDYILIAKKGYEIRDEAYGEYVRTELVQKAQHGYNEEFPEMRASFMIAGRGIEPQVVHDVRLIDVAPTLAAQMGAVLPHAEGRSIL
ncbi:MAG: alkaline phosphatase family protein [Veillonella sp.]|uniref:alkaline phosphatase family protein n=1 Tax=Veillonella sp. TaxID=1926307 RepID=UPI0025F90252|nr:ectonucleotide pyrophosphatase/phosphodiesterase [Veillonella sp.]MBS4914159.1 alkaline phosphatase family protein [Veillonella sp.]